MTFVPQEIAPYALSALVAIALSAGVWGLSARWVVTRDRRRRRIHTCLPGARQSKSDQDADVRRAARAIHRGARASSALTWRRSLQQAGLPPTLGPVLAILLGVAVVAAAALAALGAPPALALIGGCGLSPPVFILYLRWRRARRRSAMAKEFPGAIDVIIRGVKSGLPFNDCLGVVSRETQGPLREEFAKLVEEQRHGVPVADAMTRFARRVPLSEANFFAIVISLQTKTGGRLAESLENLVGVLRARIQLRAKIKSMSSEAKASGGIIGSMPPVVSLLVYLTSPDYIGLLFSETAGNIVLACSALWMLIGVAVMAKMISFDY